MSVGAGERELVGRDAEQTRIGVFLDRLIEGSAALVLEGEAGVGKTELWRHAVASALERGCRVLEARPAEAELPLSFAGLADLLADVHDEIEALPAPQRRPLSVALLLEDGGGAPPDPRAIAVGVLGIVRALARRDALLVAVDDVQWLDRASAAAIGFALRRAAGERVGALLAKRSGNVAPLELERELAPERLVLRPLSLGAIRRLLADRLGTTFSRSTLRRIHERSGGNPFYALELARALDAHGGAVAPGEELPVPEDLGRLLRDRLSALPPETAEPLAAVAALAEPSLAVAGAGGSLEPAFAAGVLVLEGDRVRFAHPLLAAAAYDAVRPDARRALHRRLAEAVEDPEQRARQLALGAEGPDSRLARLLGDAAAHAHARGAPEAAAELADLALERDEPGDRDALALRTADAARYHLLAGDDRRSLELLERALAATPAGPARARLLLGKARCTWDVTVATEVLEEALAEGRGDAGLEAEILERLSHVVLIAGSAARSEEYARAAVGAAERHGDPATLARSLGTLAFIGFTRGRGIDPELMERALALEPECDSLILEERPVSHFGAMCKWTGDVDRSRALLDEARRIGERQGDSTVTSVLWYTCFLELLEEKWRHGLELAGELVERAAEMERDDALLAGLTARTYFLAHLGDEEGARLAAAEAEPLYLRIRGDMRAIVEGFALSLLELSLDRPAEALRLARVNLRDDGWEEPGAQFAFAIHAEAAIAVGEHAEAEEVLDWVEERAVRLDREWALACSARCRGLLAAARGDDAGALAAFERALAEHERVQYRRFDLARTLLAQGETLRRLKRKRPAREAIEAAIAIFDELGAALWSAKARRELARISGRRTAEGLTETERRIAELVAAGRSNKEVASELHVTVRTVESNLTKVYAKLGVRSRTQLAARLSA